LELLCLLQSCNPRRRNKYRVTKDMSMFIRVRSTMYVLTENAWGRMSHRGINLVCFMYSLYLLYYFEIIQYISQILYTIWLCEGDVILLMLIVRRTVLTRELIQIVYFSGIYIYRRFEFWSLEKNLAYVPCFERMNNAGYITMIHLLQMSTFLQMSTGI
jgi:hypothetical protein